MIQIRNNIINSLNYRLYTNMKNFINWLLSDNPTKQQLKNRKRCKKFFKDYFGWGDTFMEIQFFILGLGFLLFTLIVAFELGGVI